MRIFYKRSQHSLNPTAPVFTPRQNATYAPSAHTVRFVHETPVDFPIQCCRECRHASRSNHKSKSPPQKRPVPKKRSQNKTKSDQEINNLLNHCFDNGITAIRQLDDLYKATVIDTSKFDEHNARLMRMLKNTLSALQVLSDQVQNLHGQIQVMAAGIENRDAPQNPERMSDASFELHSGGMRQMEAHL